MRHFALLLLLVCSGGLAHAGNWAMDSARSTLSFRGTQQGEPFDGSFARFIAEVAFDPAKPEAIALSATIDTTSVSTANAERDSAIIMPEWFHVERFPRAQFRTLGCVAKSAGAYDCKAELTIRDKTQPLTFPFTWAANPDGSAALKAQVTLNRLDFDVGSGDWADPESVGLDVTVRVDLVLRPATP